MDAKEPLPVLIEVLNECFNPRAEEHSSLATQLYFAGKQGSIVTELRRHAHHLIQGRMGTGKTMVLKFLSISSQLHGGPVSPKPKFIGIYIGLSPAWLHPLASKKELPYLQLFESWFCLFAAESVIRELRNLPEPALSQSRSTACVRLAKLLGIPETGSEHDFLETLERERDAIQDCFHSSEPSEETIRDLLERNHRRRIRKFFEKLAITLKEIFSPFVDPNACTFFLLDQFEHCASHQQQVIAQLLATSGAASPFFMKIGCRPHRPLTLPGISPQDFRVVHLEMAANSHEYTRFANEVISLRFNAVASQLRSQGVPDKYVTMFGSVAALLGNYSFVMQRDHLAHQLRRAIQAPPVIENEEVGAFRALAAHSLPRRFGGLSTIRLLSGGFVRTLLSLTYQILRVALEQHAHPTVRSRKIALEIQDKAIKAEIHNELGPRLRAILSSSTGEPSMVALSEDRKEQVESLLRRTVRMFHRDVISEKTKPAILNFQLPFNLQDPSYRSLLEILHLLRDLGYISGNFSVDQPTLTLAPIVAPWIEQVEIPPEALNVLRLTQVEALRLIQPFVLPPNPVKQLIKVFYASGWRSPLEQCILRKIRGEIHALDDHGKNFEVLVGNEPTGANHVLFEQLSELIRSSHYLIAEVSSLNENVAFEIGLARAWRKRTYHLVNPNFFELIKGEKRGSRFVNFLRGHQFFRYELLSDSEPDVDSLREALRSIGHHHEKRKQRKRKRPINLQESGKLNVIPYFHIEASSPAASWYSDLLRLSRRDLRREPLNPGPPDNRRSQFDYYADAIDRSTHIIIDLSHGDPFACLLYGYALATDRQVLAIWHKPDSGPITDIRGLPDGGAYENKDHLFEGIIKPWLSGDGI